MQMVTGAHHPPGKAVKIGLEGEGPIADKLSLRITSADYSFKDFSVKVLGFQKREGTFEASSTLTERRVFGPIKNVIYYKSVS